MQRKRRLGGQQLEAALAAAGVTVSRQTIARLARAYLILREDLDTLHVEQQASAPDKPGS